MQTKQQVMMAFVPDEQNSRAKKLSRAMFMPARITLSNISGEFEAGPMVATILVLCAGSIIFSPLKGDNILQS
jgi:hypothetical protein